MLGEIITAIALYNILSQQNTISTTQKVLGLQTELSASYTAPIPSPTPSKAAPTSTPSPTTEPLTLDELFEKYATKHSIDKAHLKRIAYCESKLNPQAGNGPYQGLYQFSEITWRAYRTRMRLNPDPKLRHNAESSINTAAYMLANGAANAWPNCK